MTMYLISFDDGWMDISDEDLPQVSADAFAVVEAAEQAGVWVFGAGLAHQVPNLVAVDGTVTDGPFPETKEHIGGFAVVEVDTRAEAIEWAKRIATACRCQQEVYEILPGAR